MWYILKKLWFTISRWNFNRLILVKYNRPSQYRLKLIITWHTRRDFGQKSGTWGTSITGSTVSRNGNAELRYIRITWKIKRFMIQIKRLMTSKESRNSTNSTVSVRTEYATILVSLKSLARTNIEMEDNVV